MNEKDEASDTSLQNSSINEQLSSEVSNVAEEKFSPLCRQVSLK